MHIATLIQFVGFGDFRRTVIFHFATPPSKTNLMWYFFYYAAVQSMSIELYEADTIDGTGMWQRLWHGTIPQISGTLLLAFVNQIISVFRVLDRQMVMTGGGCKA